MKAVCIIVILILSALILSSCEQINQYVPSNQGSSSIKDISLSPEKYENQTITITGTPINLDAEKCWASQGAIKDSEGYFVPFISPNRILTYGKTYTLSGKLKERVDTSYWGNNRFCYVLVE